VSRTQLPDKIILQKNYRYFLKAGKMKRLLEVSQAGKALFNLIILLGLWWTPGNWRCTSSLFPLCFISTLTRSIRISSFFRAGMKAVAGKKLAGSVGWGSARISRSLAGILSSTSSKKQFQNQMGGQVKSDRECDHY
jgi:hypothetical protein